MPESVVDNLKIVLKGGAAIENLSNSFSVKRSLPHGHVAAVLGTLKKLDLHNLVEGLDWITALRASQIRKLVEQEAVQLSLFDETDLVEFSCADYPTERLIACRNPFLASEFRGRQAPQKADAKRVLRLCRRAKYRA